MKDLMKNGLYAIYNGKEYTSGGMGEGKIILRSTDIGDVKNGFELCKPFYIKNEIRDIVCLKILDKSEVDSYYRLRTKAIYQGYEFEVVEEKGDEISIVTMVGDYRNWLNLGMKCIDRYVYQKWINKSEAEIKIVKEEL